MTGDLLVHRDGPVLRVTFNRPRQRNAMTWAMYQGLDEACRRAEHDERVKVLVLRGVDATAFVSGTDIGQFTEFGDGEDGVRYERRIAEVLDRLETVRVPSLAVVDGYCVGAGLAIAAVCDLRIATPAARFGVPIARTLGNCLSMNSMSLLAHHLGPARTLDLLLRARLLTGEEAHAAGFVAELCPPDELDDQAGAIAARLVEHAPLSMWAAKQAMHRLRAAQLPDGDDLVRTVFGSADFHSGVRAFLTKQPPEWTGH